jgi:hypothetical protein
VDRSSLYAALEDNSKGGTLGDLKNADPCQYSTLFAKLLNLNRMRVRVVQRSAVLEILINIGGMRVMRSVFHRIFGSAWKKSPEVCGFAFSRPCGIRLHRCRCPNRPDS